MENKDIKNERFFEMTVGEYFRELELMEKQYGCEEELYPFINMFLRNGENAKDISIRAVANMTNADIIPGRKLFSGNISFPDIAILDKDFELAKIKESEKKDPDAKKNTLLKDYKKNTKKIYGCVEAKELKTKLLDGLGDKKFTIKYGKCKRYIVKPSPDKPHYYYYIDLPNDKPIQIKQLTKKEKDGWKLHNAGVKDLKDVTDEWYCNVYDIKYMECSRVDDKDEIIKIDIEDSNGKITDEGQIFGELLWYGKVLYTNGIEWKLLEILECDKKKGNDAIYYIREEIYKECILTKGKKWYNIINGKEIKVECKNIANLTKCYEEYKKNKVRKTDKNKVDFSIKQGLEEESCEWKKLMLFFDKINWI